ncbi:MAG: DNA-formamidopyrimidine glycosylase family protein [Chromatiales bacterium]
MPEGDTVHKLAARLHAELAGQSARSVDVPTRYGRQLSGQTLTGVDCRGKHLFIRFGNGLAVRVHLGLYGSWHRYAPGERWKKPARQARLVLCTDEALFVCFNAREVELLRGEGLAERDLAHRLGPDLLAPDVRTGEICARARRVADPETPLVDVLLDQRIAAGIGNVYKSEVLFLQGTDPFAVLGQVDDGRLAALFGCAAGLLGRNLGGGPRVTRPSGEGRDRLWVYDRAGRPCLRCGGVIQIARWGRGRRSTYWCAYCQSPPAAS